jgi:hypothetical protein
VNSCVSQPFYRTLAITENAKKVAIKDSDKDREQASPELEMLRRKERIEKWRAQKRKKELDISAGKVWLDGLYN